MKYYLISSHMINNRFPFRKLLFISVALSAILPAVSSFISCTKEDEAKIDPIPFQDVQVGDETYPIPISDNELIFESRASSSLVKCLDGYNFDGACVPGLFGKLISEASSSSRTIEFGWITLTYSKAPLEPKQPDGILISVSDNDSGEQRESCVQVYTYDGGSALIHIIQKK